MNKKMRILAALAAAVIAISATAMLSGCGGNKDGDKTATTVPATTAQAMTKAAESSAANGDNGNGSAAQDNDAQLPTATARTTITATTKSLKSTATSPAKKQVKSLCRTFHTLKR